MSDKMLRFTQRARWVMSAAQEEAERLRHSEIGTVHLLLGLVRDEGGIAGQTLAALGVEHDALSRHVEQNARSGQRTPFTKLDLSPGTKKVLEMSVEEARSLGHHYIGTEHLLLALVSYDEGAGSDILKALDLSADQIRKQIHVFLQEGTQTRRSSRPRSRPVRRRQSQDQSERRRSTQLSHLVLGFARQEAERLKHRYIGPEHVLLALLHDEEGVAGRALRTLGLEYDELSQFVAQHIKPQWRMPFTRLDLSPGTKKVLEMSVEEARNLGHGRIGTEHLLLALVSDDEGMSAEILKSFALTPDKVRKQVTRILQEDRAAQSVSITSESRWEARAEQERPSQRKTSYRSFTFHALRVLVLAQQEAEQMQHARIGNEHLFLGLVQEQRGAASRLLSELGVNYERSIDAVRAHSKSPWMDSSTDKVELAPETERSVERAVEEALKSADRSIGTEHLLLALTVSDDPVMEGVLSALGLTAAAIRTAVMKSMYPSKGEQKPRQGPDYTHRMHGAVYFAAVESLKMGHSYVGAAHVLVALMHMEDGVAYRVLRDLGVDYERCVKVVAAAAQSNAPLADSDTERGIWPELDNMINGAVGEARRLGHPVVDTEHLLLALTREDAQGLGAIFETLGVTAHEVRKAVLHALDK